MLKLYVVVDQVLKEVLDAQRKRGFFMNTPSAVVSHALDDTEIALKTQLLDEIAERIKADQKWGRVDFICAQLFIWLTILASFLTAILAAADEAPAWLIAILAAVPGTAIVVEKSFSFSKRARWHWEMVAALEELQRKLKYQNSSVKEIARQLSSYRSLMEISFPALNTDSLNNSSANKQDSSRSSERF